MNKVVYNSKYGGYCLSLQAAEWLAENGREKIKVYVKEELRKKPNDRYGYWLYDIERHDPDLVRCVETLGRKANGGLAELEVKELKGNRYRIDNYDGWAAVIEPEDEEYITIT